MGVWIETSIRRHTCIIFMSHPSWVCGLKQRLRTATCKNMLVTPFVGVWIETAKASILHWLF